MKQFEMFSSAKWLGSDDYTKDSFFILKSSFNIERVKKATLRVLGLGFFHCYINGDRVGNDLFLPLNTDFEARDNFPVDEVISGHRIYVPEYDITSMLVDRENIIVIHFGGGWYTHDGQKKFGDAKAIWRIFGEDENGGFDFVSSENDKIAASYIKDYDFTESELQDFTCMNADSVALGKEDIEWKPAIASKPLDTDYLFSDCQPDRVCGILGVKKIKDCGSYAVYDCGVNTSGYPVIKFSGKSGEKITVIMSEEMTADGELHPDFTQDQKLTFICDGSQRTVRPLFTWFAFRYFAVYGKATPECVEVVHSDVSRISDFKSDNELLNWIHDTFVNTQLANMHAGIPSDCPHLERRGYTGDGQLACHAVMNIFDAEKFYRKWIKDIQDCQDKLSGHIQYTAPYTHSGGGPGGWGSAIVEVPYQFYMHYGDSSVLEECYPNMLRYFDYLESHSELNLVISDKDGEWCLGDWCTPVSVVLPAPFVNNYFYIKSLGRCIEIAKIIGREEDIPLFEERIAQRKRAVMSAYFNKWDGNFLGGQQGANAFAVDMGLGDERTYNNMVEKYKKLKGFDTGIFGTDILTRVLFEHGDGQLAAELLTSDSLHSFGEMKRLGATTLWEYWPGSLRDRSHNHPMFGAVTAYLYDYLLGIRAKEGCAGYSEIVISPMIVNGINSAEGGRTFKSGVVSVSYKKIGNSVDFIIDIPEKQPAEFVFKEGKRILVAGVNKFNVEI
ncbi:MAG: family 78 glycoside hydrolase catalytic domain [Clostridia bacterium]|nr:family 78 glycoside hydrolase catalytic domain [Clostridia bacterium]